MEEEIKIMSDGINFMEISVLVVDDSRPMRQLIHKHLTDIGVIMITECESGEEAAGTLFSTNEKPPFDIILLDWHMGELSGLELLKRIVAFENTANIPVIMLTSEQKSYQVKEAIKTGAADYIIKPLKPKIFELKLKRIFNKKNADPKKNGRVEKERDVPLPQSPSGIQLTEKQREVMEEQIAWVKSVFKK